MAEPATPIEQQPTHLAPVEVTALEEIRDPVVAEAEALTITSQAEYEAAAAFLTQRIKPTLKAIEASCKPVVAAANAVHKAATKQRADLEAPLKEAERVVKGKLGEYTAEQQRIRQEEIRRQEEKRQREAEEEQLQRAAEAEAAGDTAKADAVLEEPTPEPSMPAPPPPPPPAKAKGISTRAVWQAEVVDMSKLVEAVAAGTVPVSVLKVDQSKLLQQVRALDGQVNYPGVRVFSTQQVSARSAR